MNFFGIFSFHRSTFFNKSVRYHICLVLCIWGSLSLPCKDHHLYYRTTLVISEIKFPYKYSSASTGFNVALSLYLCFCKSPSLEVVGCIKSALWLHPLLLRPPQREATDEFWVMSHTAPYLEFLWASPLNCFKLLLQRPALTSLSKSRKYLIILQFSFNHHILQHWVKIRIKIGWSSWHPSSLVVNSFTWKPKTPLRPANILAWPHCNTS